MYGRQLLARLSGSRSPYGMQHGSERRLLGRLLGPATMNTRAFALPGAFAPRTFAFFASKPAFQQVSGSHGEVMSSAIFDFVFLRNKTITIIQVEGNSSCAVKEWFWFVKRVSARHCGVFSDGRRDS